MLSEISQTEKDKYCMISLMCGILNKQTNKLIETQSTLLVGNGESVKMVKGHELSDMR